MPSCAVAVTPAIARQRLFGDDGDDVLDLAAAVVGEQRGKALILEVAAEQGANPGARDAEREAGLIITGQHEDVAEQLANGAGSMSLRSGARASPRFSSQ